MTTTYRHITVEIQERYGDAVADLLMEAGAGGASIEDHETSTPGDAPPSRARVRAAFTANDGVEARVAALLGRFFTHLEPVPDAVISWSSEEEGDWAEAWKRHWKPQRIGTRAVVVPSWERYAPEPDDLVLTLDPGMAFGTGTHPTTQLCVQAIEALSDAGGSLLDVGTGSGILALFAARLGFAPVQGVDNDPTAVAIARGNAVANDLDQATRFAVSHDVGIAGAYDVVVANILMEPLIELVEPIVGHVKPHGTLVLSGLLEAQLDAVSKTYRVRGLFEQERRTLDEWGCLHLRSVRG